MIPRSKDDLIPWTDDEGGVFKFRPLIGTLELKVYEAYEALNVDYSPFLEEAAKKAKSNLKGKRLKAGQLEKETEKIAIELASKAKGTLFNSDEAKAMYDVINAVVVSHTTKNGKTYDFTYDASEYFSLNENTRIFEAINDTNGLTAEDKKK